MEQHTVKPLDMTQTALDANAHALIALALRVGEHVRVCTCGTVITGAGASDLADAADTHRRAEVA